MPRTIWNYSGPGRLVFGCGAIRELGPAARRMQVGNALIVTDGQLVRAGVVEPAIASLTAAGVRATVFDGGEPEPSFECIDRAAQAAREARPDAIVGVGGGSNMDLAKIAAAVHAHRGEYRDYLGFDRIPGPVLSLICVPTTAGTGSEVSQAAVLTDREQGIKVSTLSPYLRPRLAVVDPELTTSCPPRVTADSGMDALTHAIEAVTATSHTQLDLPPGELFPYEGKNPLADLFAERAIRLIGQHLLRAVRQPDDREARIGMSLAATLAGLAFSNAAVALVHAMEYPLGGTLHCTHGTGNALLLPHVMRFIAPVREGELARVAEWLGVDTSGLEPAQAAKAAVTAVDTLREQVGIPARIRDLGGREEQLAGFAAQAFSIKRLMTLTPRPVSEAAILAIYQAAW